SETAIASPLVEGLGIRQLSRSAGTAPQRVQSAEPNDYFRRILSEEIDEGEIRDQTVLRDIAEWVAGRSAGMVEKLAAATERHERYVDLWEYFGQQIPNDRFNDFVADLFARHIAARRGGQRMPALMSCWRLRNRRHDRALVPVDQLERMIRTALPVSLPLANDLYYFWTSVKYGPFTPQDRK